MGATLPLVSVFPFAALLLAIAIFPLTCGHWWEKNRNKAIVVAVLSLPVVLIFLPVWHIVNQHELLARLPDCSHWELCWPT
jgi:hypothetical protein